MYDWLPYLGLAVWAVLFITGSVFIDRPKERQRKAQELDANLDELKADLERSQRRFEEAMSRFQKVAQQKPPQPKALDETKVCDRCGTVYDDGCWCPVCAVSSSQSRAKMERAKRELGVSLSMPPPLVGRLHQALDCPPPDDESVVHSRSLPNVRPAVSRSEPLQDQREPNERPPVPPKSYPPPPPPLYTPPMAAEANEELPPPPVDPEAKRWADFVKRSQESS